MKEREGMRKGEGGKKEGRRGGGEGGEGELGNGGEMKEERGMKGRGRVRKD